MTTTTTLTKMSDDELHALAEVLSEGIRTLEQQSEAFGERARIYWCALAMQLDEEETLDHLVAMAAFAEEQKKVVAVHTPDPGLIVH